MAANLLPAAVARNFHFQADAVDAIDVNVIPTTQQVIRETNRYLEFQHHRDQLNEQEYRDAIVRQHKVVSLASDNELGNTNTALMAELQAIRAEMTAARAEMTAGRAEMTAGFNQINRRLDGMDARINTDSARSFNSHIDSVTSSTVAFRQVVKHIRDHPVQAGLPPAVPNVHFQAEYAVGDEPPNNLMPLNSDELKRMASVEDIAHLRPRLRAIYWFYNDPRLALGAHANLVTCTNIINALERFQKYP